MTKLVALTAEAHGELKIKPQQNVVYAQNAHMLSLRVTEVAQAIIDFPILASRMSNGDMSLSALTSFQPNENLFVSNGMWTSAVQSTAMKTYPVFLMRDPDGGSEPILGIDEESEALSPKEGTALFDKKGKPSLHLKQLKAQLLEDSKNTVHTFQFFKTLKEFDLLRPVDLILNYTDGQANRITGLSMIHEDNLQKLSSDRLTELRDRGYLAPIYAMLFSVFQLNALIRRNNEFAGMKQIKNINLEVSKSNRPI